MSKQSFPYYAWVLTPGFTPKLIELVDTAHDKDWHITTAKKYYHVCDLFSSKKDAIEAGWRKLDDQTSALKKRSDAISKKKSNLTKHSEAQS